MSLEAFQDGVINEFSNSPIDFYFKNYNSDNYEFSILLFTFFKIIVKVFVFNSDAISIASSKSFCVFK